MATSAGKKLFSTKPKKECGQFEIILLKKPIPVILGYVRTADLILDPKNRRIETDQKRLSQAAIKKNLQEGKLEDAAEKLSQAIEFNGGLSEAIWVQSYNGKFLVIEGNRRTAEMIERGEETVLVNILPDDLTEEQKDAFTSLKHVGGLKEWSSHAQSKMAYDFLTLHNWPIEDIMTHLQFKSKQLANKYIGAYVWLKESGLSSEHWSKFYHLYLPVTRAHFGYNEETREFADENRTAANEKTPHPDVVDKAAGRITDFAWFCKLVENGQIKNCLNSSQLIGPLIRNADQWYAQMVFKTLHSKPKKNDLTPGDAAQEQFDSYRRNNIVSNRTVELRDHLENILGDTAKCSAYMEKTDDNEVLKSNIILLQNMLKQFADKVASVDSTKKPRRKAG